MALYINNKQTGEISQIAGIQAVDELLNEESINPVQNKTITAKLKDINKIINEVKKSVSDGKSKVASAITEKGVSTEATDTFDTMAKNIGKIRTGTSNTPILSTTMTSDIVNTPILSTTMTSDIVQCQVTHEIDNTLD